MTLNDSHGDIRTTSEKNVSYWTNDSLKNNLQKINENLETDVVIAGGGLAGLSVAYCLLRSGKKIILVEDDFIGSGETGRTTAHLVTALDDRYYHLEKIFGEEKTKLIAESHCLAIDLVEQIIKDENIDCGFERVNGYLFRHPSDRKDSLQLELKAVLKAELLVKETDKTPGMLKPEKSLCFLNQAQLHPLKYLMGLRKAIEKKGGRIFTGTHVSKINDKGVTTANGFTVTAKHIVAATNSPVNNLFIPYLKQQGYRTYVIGALIKKDSLPKALWWDTGDFEKNYEIPPYHYVRIHPYDEQHDLLLSGGEDHPAVDISESNLPEEKRYKLIEEWTRNYFPIGEIVYRWSGQVMQPVDGIAFIGRNPFDYDNIFIVTGDSGNGMTYCSFAGLLISDLINGKENKWEKLYSPLRLTFKKNSSKVEI